MDVDAFFAAAELVRRPELVGRCVAVGGDQGRSVIATANYEARRWGVHSAMPVAQARRRCPGLVLLPVDRFYLRAVSWEVVAAVATVVAELEPVSLDEMYFTLEPPTTAEPSNSRRGEGAPEARWEEAEALAAAVQGAIATRTGLSASVGVAPGRAAAKMASEAAKPGGILVVAPRALDAFLCSRTLADVPGCGPVTQAALAQVGITTVIGLREAAAAGREALSRVLGGAASARLVSIVRGEEEDGSTGGAGSGARGRGVPASLSTEETFPRDLTDAGALAEAADRLARRVVGRMRAAGLGATGVTLKARSGRFVDVSRSARLGEATAESGAVRDAVAGLVDEVWAGVAPSARLVGVALTGLTERIQGRLGFDEAPGPQRGHSAVIGPDDDDGQGGKGMALPARPPRAGSRVRHSLLGEGIVVAADVDAAVVRFDGHGVRVIEEPGARLVTAPTPGPTPGLMPGLSQEPKGSGGGPSARLGGGVRMTKAEGSPRAPAASGTVEP